MSTPEHIDLLLLQSERNRYREALEQIEREDHEHGPGWFADIAHAALDAYPERAADRTLETNELTLRFDPDAGQFVLRCDDARKLQHWIHRMLLSVAQPV